VKKEQNPVLLFATHPTPRAPLGHSLAHVARVRQACDRGCHRSEEIYAPASSPAASQGARRSTVLANGTKPATTGARTPARPEHSAGIGRERAHADRIVHEYPTRGNGQVRKDIRGKRPSPSYAATSQIDRHDDALPVCEQRALEDRRRSTMLERRTLDRPEQLRHRQRLIWRQRRFPSIHRTDTDLVVPGALRLDSAFRSNARKTNAKEHSDWQPGIRRTLKSTKFDRVVGRLVLHSHPSRMRRISSSVNLGEATGRQRRAEAADNG
jgi:hypothetical protein